jgi:FkbM family methyltransferase
MLSSTPARSILKLNYLPFWEREVEVWGNRVTATSLDRLLNLYLHHLGIRGTDERDFFIEHVHPGMRALDIGANQGLYTLLLSRIVGGQGHVFAFEPDPVIFRSLRRHCDQNGAANTELHNVALGFKHGSMKLYRSRLNAGDNRLAKSAHPEWFEETDASVVSLDSLLEATPVDFIKMDVQGWEYEVFRGMEHTLRESPNVRILFEYWPLGLRNAGCRPTDCLNFLRAQGFSLSQLSARKLIPVTDFEEFTRRIGRQHCVNLFAVRNP